MHWQHDSLNDIHSCTVSGLGGSISRSHAGFWLAEILLLDSSIARRVCATLDECKHWCEQEIERRMEAQHSQRRALLGEGRYR